MVTELISSRAAFEPRLSGSRVCVLIPTLLGYDLDFHKGPCLPTWMEEWAGKEAQHKSLGRHRR